MVGTLGECCRQVEAEQVSNSRNNIHQTWEWPYKDSLYKHKDCRGFSYFPSWSWAILSPKNGLISDANYTNRSGFKLDWTHSFASVWSDAPCCVWVSWSSVGVIPMRIRPPARTSESLSALLSVTFPRCPAHPSHPSSLAANVAMKEWILAAGCENEIGAVGIEEGNSVVSWAE